MAVYTKSTNNYQGRYYKITLTQTTYDSNTGIVNVDWKFEVLGGSSGYYSAPATSVKAYNPVDGTTTTIYSHNKQVYSGGSASFPIAKGSRNGTKQFQTDANGDLTLEITFHKDSMAFSGGTWSAFNSVENWVLDQIPRQTLRIRVNNEWKSGTPYVRVNGEWKRATAYIMNNGTWKRGY